MLLILADVYRIATLRADEGHRPMRREDRHDETRRKRWYDIAGLML